MHGADTDTRYLQAVIKPVSMLKKPATQSKQLFRSVKLLLEAAQNHVVKNINTTMLFTYFHIGRMIVENEQKGLHRAGYASKH